MSSLLTLIGLIACRGQFVFFFYIPLAENRCHLKTAHWINSFILKATPTRKKWTGKEAEADKKIFKKN